MLGSAPLPCKSRSRTVIGTMGYDPTLCGIGADPNGSLLAAGLRVPSAPFALPSLSIGVGRYLFQMATVRLPSKGSIWLVGLAQLLTIWQETAPVIEGVLTPPSAPVEKLIGRYGSGNPLWRPPDATVSWHLRLVRDPPAIPPASQSVLTTDSFAFQWSDAPALVFENAAFGVANLDGRGHPDNYLALTGYVAPNGGKPRGVDVGGLGNFQDIRFPWDDPSAQNIEPIELRGPGALVFYASVMQTNPAKRAAITVPAGMPIDPQMPEDGFATSYTSYVFGRVGCRVVIER